MGLGTMVYCGSEWDSEDEGKYIAKQLLLKSDNRQYIRGHASASIDIAKVSD